MSKQRNLMFRRIITVALLGKALLLLTHAFSLSSQRKTLFLSKLQPLRSTARKHGENNDVGEAAVVSTKKSMTSTRRRALTRTVAPLLVFAPPLGFGPRRSLAANEDKEGNDEGMVSQSKLASLLRQIPTFAIVDPRGVPYFVVGEDAKLTSYFFISYGEAKRILDVAVSSSDRAIREAKKEIRGKNGGTLTKEDEQEIGSNPWKNARITSVPLDLAVSLASKGKLAGAYFRLAPSASDIEDALALDGTDDLPEGKVPLFYVEDMTFLDGFEPLYFTKGQLEQDWRRQKTNPTLESPNIKVTELFATLTEMVRLGGTDEELKKLQFVAPPDSKSRAEQCGKGKNEPFRLGERLIVL